MSHKINGRLKNETKEKVCLFNRPSQHDSALISRPYMTSIATATRRRTPPPFTSSTLILNVIYFCGLQQRVYYLTYLRKVTKKGLENRRIVSCDGCKEGPPSTYLLWDRMFTSQYTLGYRIDI